MAGDVSKHLERAKRFLEKNRVEDAIEAYLAVLDEAPQHQEATQALGDLYARMDQPDRAAVYYGLLFDLLVEPMDETKALAIFNRFLKVKSGQQAPSSNIRRPRIELRRRTARRMRSFAGSGSPSSTRKIFRGSFVLRKRPNASARTPLPHGRFCAPGSWLRRAAPRTTRCTYWAARTNSRRRSAASDCCMPMQTCKPGMRSALRRC